LKRVVSIDGITLDNKCFISSEFDIDDYIGESSLAIDGSSVVFVQAKGSMTKEVSITSKDSGWISRDTKDALSNTVDELSKTVVFDDNTSNTYYFDHSTTPIKFTPLYEGSLWYNVEINLLKG
jgi:hypothetical protein